MNKLTTQRLVEAISDYNNTPDMSDLWAEFISVHPDDLPLVFEAVAMQRYVTLAPFPRSMELDKLQRGLFWLAPARPHDPDWRLLAAGYEMATRDNWFWAGS